ncbi:MAG: BPSS1780 family membrane protein [Burkholderiales bacterium]|jgi:hypothetical protein
MMSTNPYAAPKTQVADLPEHMAEGRFIAEGRKRPAGSGWQWIKSARALTKTRQLLWIGMFIVFAVISMGVGAIPEIGSLALTFLMPVLFGGVMLTCDKAYRGGEIEFGDFFSGFRKHILKLAGIGLVTLLAYVAIFLIIAAIFGAASALVLSGIESPLSSDPALAAGILIATLVLLGLSVPLYMAVWFSYALVTINDMPVLKSMKTSFAGCMKNMGAFLVYGLIMFFLALAASLPIFLGWLILGPILFATFYTGYRDIFYET